MRFKYLQPIHLIGPTFFVFLLLIPIHMGSGFRYALILVLSLIALAGCIHADRKSASEAGRDLLQKLARHPLRWPLLALFVCSGLSLWMGETFWYSWRTFRSEILLNCILYVSLSLFTWHSGTQLNWLKYVRRANIAFLVLYLGLLLQWVIFPQNALCVEPRFSLADRPLQDIVFLYGQMNTLFTGIKQVSAYLLLFLTLTFIDVLQNRARKKSLALFLVNLALLILTTKRAPVLALVVGLALTPLFYASARKYVLMGVGLVMILMTVVLVTNLRTFILRGDWKFISKGHVLHTKKDFKSSVSLRIHTYEAYLEYIADHPFRGIGMGRRNIKNFIPETVERAGLPHGHNTFLNYAVYTGIQGALALLLVVLFQARLFWQAWKRAREPAVMEIMAFSLVFLAMFWFANTFEDHFRHDTSTLYWLVTAVPTGIAQMVREQAGESA